MIFEYFKNSHVKYTIMMMTSYDNEDFGKEKNGKRCNWKKMTGDKN
jgi:hypothetical protein